MNKEEKESAQYQFSGYDLPRIQLDSTGDAYYVVMPHPYYRNQPEYWKKGFGVYIPPPGDVEILSEQTFIPLDL